MRVCVWHPPDFSLRVSGYVCWVVCGRRCNGLRRCRFLFYAQGKLIFTLHIPLFSIERAPFHFASNEQPFLPHNFSLLFFRENVALPKSTKTLIQGYQHSTGLHCNSVLNVLNHCSIHTRAQPIPLLMVLVLHLHKRNCITLS